jgi:hypothetical protein
MKRTVLFYAAAIAILTIMFATLYAGIQQSLRLSANDPQIQMVEDTMARLDGGADPHSLTAFKVDVSKNTSPFLIIYDKAKHVVASTAVLNGKTPQIPEGVLTSATAQHQNRVTWQPADGVRLATVVGSNDVYSVLAGRNMRDVESREGTVFKLTATGWLFSLAIIIFLFWMSRKSKKQN